MSSIMLRKVRKFLHARGVSRRRQGEQPCDQKNNWQEFDHDRILHSCNEIVKLYVLVDIGKNHKIAGAIGGYRPME